MSYFVIHNTEDGLSVDGPFDREELLDVITPAPDGGENDYGQTDPEFLSADDVGGIGGLGTDSLDEDELIILQGTVIVPEPVQRVQAFKLPDANEDDGED